MVVLGFEFKLFNFRVEFCERGRKDLGFEFIKVLADVNELYIGF